ncbi:3-alpha domain-containing protein [Devosia sp.]|uniref:3-alpha domain-containing protein n=1 Tax=Devosia sp. TaxID=1871048 RepID=UPI0035243BE3
MARCIETGRTGFYLRVLEEGEVFPCEIVKEGANLSAPSVREIHELRFHRKSDVAGMERAVAEPALSMVVHILFKKRLLDLNQGTG